MRMSEIHMKSGLFGHLALEQNLRGCLAMLQLASWPHFLAATAWIRSHRSAFEQALRLAIAGSVAFAVTKLLDLPQGLWAAVTAVIVVQGSVGASIKAAVDRFCGTAVGAIYGMVIAVAVPHTSFPYLLTAVVLALLPTGLLAALYPVFRVAPISALIILLPSSATFASPLASAFARVAEIMLGDFLGLAVALFILPSRAYSIVFSAANRVLELEGDLLRVVLGCLAAGKPTGTEVQQIHAQTRAALRKAETAAEDAARERRSHLGQQADLDPIIRSLHRIRNDLVMVARAAVLALSFELAQQLSPSLNRLADLGGDLLHSIGQAMAEKSALPDSQPLFIAIAEFDRTVESLDITRYGERNPSEVYAIRFAIMQLSHDIQDLLDRTSEHHSWRVSTSNQR